MAKRQTREIKLKGKTVVFIDWANVHGWQEKTKWQIDLGKLYQYLCTYKKIKELRFYFGTDTHPASKEQLRQARKFGFKVITKPVKYLPVRNENTILWKRKCDFDLEIGLDCFEKLDKYDGFVFFSGDGDFATLYKRLIKNKKQVIVIFGKGTLGKEVALIKKGIFLLNVNQIQKFIQKISPGRRPRA